MPTPDEFALLYAKKLIDYCDEHSMCSGCVFQSKNINCKLNFTPNVWKLKEETDE